MASDRKPLEKKVHKHLNTGHIRLRSTAFFTYLGNKSDHFCKTSGLLEGAYFSSARAFIASGWTPDFLNFAPAAVVKSARASSFRSNAK